MVDPGLPGYQGKSFGNRLDETLKNPTDQRAYAVFEALDKGYSVEKIHGLTNIDPVHLRITFITKKTLCLSGGYSSVRKLST